MNPEVFARKIAKFGLLTIEVKISQRSMFPERYVLGRT